MNQIMKVVFRSRLKTGDERGRFGSTAVSRSAGSERLGPDLVPARQESDALAVALVEALRFRCRPVQLRVRPTLPHRTRHLRLPMQESRTALQ